MEIDITQIAVGVIGIISAIVTGVVIPLIKSKVTNEQWVSIQNYAPVSYTHLTLPTNSLV